MLPALIRIMATACLVAFATSGTTPIEAGECVLRDGFVFADVLLRSQVTTHQSSGWQKRKNRRAVLSCFCGRQGGDPCSGL